MKKEYLNRFLLASVLLTFLFFVLSISGFLNNSFMIIAGYSFIGTAILSLLLSMLLLIKEENNQLSYPRIKIVFYISAIAFIAGFCFVRYWNYMNAFFILFPLLFLILSLIIITISFAKKYTMKDFVIIRNEWVVFGICTLAVIVMLKVF